ncbi:unnamed protein product, partial [Polarella glacialis]
GDPLTPVGKGVSAGLLGISSLLKTDLRAPLPVAAGKGRESGRTKQASAPVPAAAEGRTKQAPAPVSAAAEGYAKQASAPLAPVAPVSAAAAGYAKQASVPVLAPASGYASASSSAPFAGFRPRLPMPDSGNTSAQCSISSDGASSEIRTKVFRMGAPLLRSTIPVSLGNSRNVAPTDEASSWRKSKAAGSGEGDEDEGSDVETILSLSDVGCDDDQAVLSVTLDFPC